MQDRRDFMFRRKAVLAIAAVLATTALTACVHTHTNRAAHTATLPSASVPPSSVPDPTTTLPSTHGPLTSPPLPAPGPGFAAGHVTAVGDSVMLDYQMDLEWDIPGVNVQAAVSRQWTTGISLLQQAKSAGLLGAVVIVGLGRPGSMRP